MILELNVEIVAEDLFECNGIRTCSIDVAGKHGSVDRTRKAGRCCDQTLMVLAKQIHIDPRLVVIAVCVTDGRELDEILIALLVLR